MDTKKARGIMEPITIERNGEVLAHHTTESCLSHYGQAVWIVEDEDPGPGPATWKQGENEQALDVIEVKGGWLIVRQADGYLSGIIWSDGNYYANILEDTKTRRPCKILRKRGGQRIRDTFQMDPRDPDDLGGILSYEPL